jgi:hypothetical protein
VIARAHGVNNCLREIRCAITFEKYSPLKIAITITPPPGSWDSKCSLSFRNPGLRGAAWPIERDGLAELNYQFL